jgi:hypothetical protein
VISGKGFLGCFDCCGTRLEVRYLLVKIKYNNARVSYLANALRVTVSELNRQHDVVRSAIGAEDTAAVSANQTVTITKCRSLADGLTCNDACA